ncbi:DUF6194 family protein [Streptomyces sp. NPDC091272]|uniref:DUF6194 family protein n=1 Tax=Streptomyces sp. NPDC091272 TaxID=3365981 RepID=UPI0037F7A61B
MDQIIAAVRALPGALVVAPQPGDGLPEQAWGDAFFYHAPDGRMPTTVQPFATIVTKDHPGDTASALDAPDRWRVNVHVDRATFRELVGAQPREVDRTAVDHTVTDRVLPHPVYGELGWICVVSPGDRTTETVLRLLRAAHESARIRSLRRRGE